MKPVYTIHDIKQDFLEGVLKKISDLTGFSVEVLKGRKRDRDLVIARYVYCYATYPNRELNTSSGEVGAVINRDHATVLHGVNKIKADIETMYDPTMTLLRELNLLGPGVSAYNLTFKRIDLVALVREGEYLDLEIFNESYV